MTDVTIERVEIDAPRGSLGELEAFYGNKLGVPIELHDATRLGLRIGHSTVVFQQATGNERPFYHFAFLVPGNRFAAAHSWLASRTDILPHRDSDDTVFEFTFLNAHSCYFHDPAGNIVELIAHHDIAESDTPDAAFSVADLLGVSEIGLVVPDKSDAAERLRDSLGLTVWQGDPHSPDGLAFVGRQAHTVILSLPGRGWLPTGRQAEQHPVRVTLGGTQQGHVQLPGTQHHVAASRSQPLPNYRNTSPL